MTHCRSGGGHGFATKLSFSEADSLSASYGHSLVADDSISQKASRFNTILECEKRVCVCPYCFPLYTVLLQLLSCRYEQSCLKSSLKFRTSLQMFRLQTWGRRPGSSSLPATVLMCFMTHGHRTSPVITANSRAPVHSGLWLTREGMS